ncbi:MAG TPA: hypothetical protein VKS60_08245 [Stellaceae bacterium]|nr:hypothetical protein [Stellaceae bacterium]
MRAVSDGRLTVSGGHISVTFDGQEDGVANENVYIVFASYSDQMREDVNRIIEGNIQEAEGPVSIDLVKTWIGSISGVEFLAKRREKSAKLRAHVEHEGKRIVFDVGITDEHRKPDLDDKILDQDVGFLSAWLKENLGDGFIVTR